MIQIWSARNHQGYDYRQFGNSERTMLDFEGLALVTVMKKARKPKAVDETPENSRSEIALAGEVPRTALDNAWMFEALKPAPNDPIVDENAAEIVNPKNPDGTDDEFPF